ncbi:MAG TPA: c-type cytochrome [Candidatus Acidoferrum sp.]|nr:c-type cytochrome [Candidatus Acidoferrum sp.]
MRTLCRLLLAAALLLTPCISLNSAANLISQSWLARADSAASGVLAMALHTTRSSPSDLELGGEIKGLPAGSTRYITRDELLALPQATYTVTGDANFTGPTEISGVLLEELSRRLAAAPESDLIVAICVDRYRGNYSRAYVAAHHPLLVLKINGKSPAGWPRPPEGHGSDMGPYMISHPDFVPSFKILTQEEEPQIPWGVVRVEFRDEKTVFGAIAPRGPNAAAPEVQAGYRLAQQNCFRCHNLGSEGGEKSGRNWAVLSAWAATSPEYFAAYVRNPQAKNAKAQMPGNPGYDDATIRALIAYFQTFSSQEKEKP